jgi:hypothetical protein
MRSVCFFAEPLIEQTDNSHIPKTCSPMKKIDPSRSIPAFHLPNDLTSPSLFPFSAITTRFRCPFSL